MTLATLRTQPVTITNRAPGTEPDVRGNLPLEATGSYDTVAYFEQTATTEVLVDRDTVESDGLLVLAAGEALGPLDLVAIGDDVYEVVGEPALVHNPRLHRTSHVEARLRRTEG